MRGPSFFWSCLRSNFQVPRIAACCAPATRGANSIATSRGQPNLTMSSWDDGIRGPFSAGKSNCGLRANQPSAPQRDPESNRKMDVVLGLLVRMQGGLVDPGAVDVVIRGHIEAEHAPQAEAERRAGHPTDVVLVLRVLIGVAAPPDVAAAAAQAEPDWRGDREHEVGGAK